MAFNTIVPLFQQAVAASPGASLTPASRSKALADMLAMPQPKTPQSWGEGLADALNMGLKGYLDTRSLRQGELDKQAKATALADALFGKSDPNSPNVMDPRHDQLATMLANGTLDPSALSPMLTNKMGLTPPSYDYTNVNGTVVKINKATGQADPIYTSPTSPINGASDLVQIVGPDGKPQFVSAASAVGKMPYAKPTGLFHTLTDPAERTAAGIDAADKGVYQQDDTTKRVYAVGSGGGLAGNANSDIVTQLADGVESGNVPPDMKSFYKYKAPVTAELQKRGTNLSELTTDWSATQRHYASLNSTQQTRLRQNISTVKGTLSTVRQLAEEWNAGGFPLLNAATRQLALQGALGPDANRIVTLMGAQIADVTGEMGSVLMGGNSPTDHAMELAAQNLSADWSYPTLTAALDQFEKNIAFRENAIASVGTAGVTNSQYNYDQPSGPAGGPASLAPTATALPKSPAPITGGTAPGKVGSPLAPGAYDWDPVTMTFRPVQ